MVNMTELTKAFNEFEQNSDTKKLVRAIQGQYPGWGTDAALYQMSDDASYQETQRDGDQGWSNLVWYTTAVALFTALVRNEPEVVFENFSGDQAVVINYNPETKQYTFDGPEVFKRCYDTELSRWFAALVDEIGKLC